VCVCVCVYVYIYIYIYIYMYKGAMDAQFHSFLTRALDGD